MVGQRRRLGATPVTADGGTLRNTTNTGEVDDGDVSGGNFLAGSLVASGFVQAKGGGVVQSGGNRESFRGGFVLVQVFEQLIDRGLAGRNQG